MIVPSSANSVGKQRNKHALKRPRHHITHIQQHADAHKDKAGDQAVAESQGVNGLQPIDLHDVDQIVRIRHQRVNKQGASLAAFEKHHPRVDGRHAQPHRDHQKGLQHLFGAQINQQKAQQHQKNASPHHGGFGSDQGGNALEQVEKT